MRNQVVIRLHSFLERVFPERRVFLRSDTDTRFIRFRPATQLVAFAGASAVIAWTIVATAILLMDSIGSGNYREQARRDQETYEMRLNALESQRDARAHEAAAAQERFNSALEQVSAMQSELLSAETRLRELETGIDVIQATLRRTMNERDSARAQGAKLAKALQEKGGAAGPESAGAGGEGLLGVLTATLDETARERDRIGKQALEAKGKADEMARELALTRDRNDQIFRQLENAMSVSVEPLDKMFRKVGLDPEAMIDTVRKGYSGFGGPSLPLAFTTRGEAPSPDVMRAGRILDRLDELNLYRIAVQKAPFGMPVKARFRYTSPFGMRWGRMHKGIDMAAPRGTAIYAPADGVVTHAGWSSGYGRLVKIKHAFGLETRYGHMSRIRVKKGQRVSRGDRIGDMGSTGRSTGPHLHYEIRVDGKAINPMIYIKAAKNAF